MHSTAAVLERISSCVLHNMSPTGDHESGRSFGLGCMLGHRPSRPQSGNALHTGPACYLPGATDRSAPRYVGPTRTTWIDPEGPRPLQQPLIFSIGWTWCAQSVAQGASCGPGSTALEPRVLARLSHARRSRRRSCLGPSGDDPSRYVQPAPGSLPGCLPISCRLDVEGLGSGAQQTRTPPTTPRAACWTPTPRPAEAAVLFPTGPSRCVDGRYAVEATHCS